MTFEQFHAENPWVYEMLCKLARQAKARGRTRLGIRLLLEVCRWERFIQTSSTDFRINNNHAPAYSRLIMATEPDLKGIFRTRYAAGDDDDNWNLDD